VSAGGAPIGLPGPSYYEALATIEEGHWWYRGMRAIARSLLGARRGPLLDAGCGAGGFLAWSGSLGFAPLAGTDLSGDALTAAARRVPGADLRLAPLWELPFADGSFAVAACNDVLQHVEQARVREALLELRRVLRADGVLLLRTNGARRARVEAADWRVYDRGTLRDALREAGFRCVRLSYVNVAGSLLAAARGRGPAPPTATTHGIPRPTRGGGALRYGVLRAEAALLRVPGAALPYGHTLVALAEPSTTRSPVAADR
jgi:SAM-dependent methyltransferase